MKYHYNPNPKWEGLERKSVSLFNQMIRGGLDSPTPCYDETAKMGQMNVRTRTFKETIGDQISYHQRKVQELKAVYDALTPELEKFVEALQKVSG